MFILLSMLLLCFYQINSLNVKVFVPNTNYGNQLNWKESRVPCDQSHIIFPNQSPKILLNGSSIIYHISEMVLPQNGELVLDDLTTMTVTDSLIDSDCDVIMSHYGKVQPDFWYNPNNWCQASSLASRCLKTPQIEASLVPSEADTAVFRKANTFYVGIKSSESKIMARRILLREKMFQKTFEFRQKIRRTSQSNVVEFENVDNNYPPIIELTEKRCRGNRCFVNSNLKRMKDICSYVQCRPVSCRRPIKPTGSCCHICGDKFVIKTKKHRSVIPFEIWFDQHMVTYYNEKIIYNVLVVGESMAEIVIASIDGDADVPARLADDLIDKIMLEKQFIGVDSVEDFSWPRKLIETTSYRSTFVVLLIVLSIILIIVLLVVFRRKLTSISNVADKINIDLPKIPKMPNIKWPTINFNFFRDTFPRTRLSDEVDPGAAPGSLYPSMTGAIEAFELPEKVTDVSFDNPIYDAEIDFEDSLQ